MDKKMIEEDTNSRRSFLKKAAYAAPAIVALGSITKPTNAMASCISNCQDQNDFDNTITPPPPPGSGEDESSGFKF